MTSKKLLSVMLALVFALSLCVALPVSADGVTATVGGASVADGGQISAVSTVVLTLPEAVADLTAVTFSEQAKKTTTTAADGSTVEAYYPWYARNFEGTLSNDNTTLTVVFERGDISSNSTYKFEFDTDVEAEGAEYTFNFITKAEVTATGETVYYAENFSRYKSNVANDLDMGGFAASGTQPHNLAPILKIRGWVGSVGGGYTMVMTYDDAPALKMYGNGNNFLNLGTNPEYSAPLSALTHTGESTAEFKLADVTKWADFNGITITSADGLTLDVYVETVAKSINADKDFAAGSSTKIGSKTYASTDKAGGWHTLKYVTTTTYTANSSAYSKTLLKVILDDTVIWATNGADAITMPAYQHGSGGGGGVAGFNKAVAALPSNVTQVDFSQLWAAAGSTSLYVRYAEYKDYVAPAPALVSTANNYAESDSISWTFDQPIALTSLTKDSVLLERQTPDGSAWKKMDGSAFASVNGNTVTVTFEEGDLTAGLNYRIKLATGVTSAEGAAWAGTTDYITFTAKVQDHYYMNENFEQYMVGYSYSGAETEPYPFYYNYGWHGNSASGTQTKEGVQVDATGDKYLYLYGIDKVKSWRYNQAYAMALPEGEAGHRGIITYTLGFIGTAGSIFDVSGIGVSPSADGTWTISYRHIEVGSNDPNNKQIERYTALDTYETGDTLFDGSEKHTITIDRENHDEYLAGTYRSITTIYGVTIDGVAVEGIPATGLRLPYSFYQDDTVLVNRPSSKSGGNIVFMLHGGADGQSHACIYGISYRDAIAVDAAATADALTFTVKNDTTASISAIPVLAVYDGTDFVRVDGLNATATTIAAGATETFTKTITSDESGYTYKFMLLDSKDSLKPLWYATKGTIQ